MEDEYAPKALLEWVPSLATHILYLEIAVDWTPMVRDSVKRLVNMSNLLQIDPVWLESTRVPPVHTKDAMFFDGEQHLVGQYMASFSQE